MMKTTITKYKLEAYSSHTSRLYHDIPLTQNPNQFTSAGPASLKTDRCEIRLRLMQGAVRQSAISFNTYSFPARPLKHDHDQREFGGENLIKVGFDGCYRSLVHARLMYSRVVWQESAHFGPRVECQFCSNGSLEVIHQ